MSIQQMLLGASGLTPQECLTTAHTDLFGAHKYSGTANTWNGPDGGSPSNLVNNSNLLTINSSNHGFMMTKSVESDNDNGSGTYPGYGWNFNGYLGYPVFWTWWTYMRMAGQGGKITSAATYDNSHSGKGFTVQNNYMNHYNQTYGAFMFNTSKYYIQCDTYTGDGTSNRAIDHSLDCVPAVMIIKSTDSSTDWVMYHYKAGNAQKFIINRESNNTSNQYQGLQSDSTVFNSQTPDRFKFYVGNNADSNANGVTYMCLTFAGNHDENDHTQFGGGCNEAMIACNMYTGNHSTAPTSVGLGFNPRFLWTFPQYGENGYGAGLVPSMSANCSNLSESDVFSPGNAKAMHSSAFWQATGSNTFQLQSNSLFCNQQGIDYYYIAIR